MDQSSPDRFRVRVQVKKYTIHSTDFQAFKPPFYSVPPMLLK